MGMSVGGGKKAMAEINVVPLVDITLVLLIIFMVMTPIMQRGYDLSIPEKNTNPTPVNQAPSDQLVLTVRIDGVILINKTEVAIDALPTKIEDLIRGRANKMVFFQAHDDVVYQDAIAAMDGIRAGGATVGLVTSDLQ